MDFSSRFGWGEGERAYRDSTLAQFQAFSVLLPLPPLPRMSPHASPLHILHLARGQPVVRQQNWRGHLTRSSPAGSLGSGHGRKNGRFATLQALGSLGTHRHLAYLLIQKKVQKLSIERGRRRRCQGSSCLPADPRSANPRQARVPSQRTQAPGEPHQCLQRRHCL